MFKLISKPKVSHIFNCSSMTHEDKCEGTEEIKFVIKKSQFHFKWMIF